MNIEMSPKEYEIHANWGDAKFYCFALNIDGKTDWRLPTRDELNEIYLTELDFEDDWHWTSTIIRDNFAWGTRSNGWNISTEMSAVIFVRAVRDI